MTRRGAYLFVAPALALAGASLASCTRSSAASSCGPVEAIVEPTQGHVFPGVTVNYQHHPPTSGRHYADAPEPGAHRAPIDERSQVAGLELGWVLLQYGSKVGAADRRALEKLATTSRTAAVVVAPALRIDGGRTVAFTAWQHRQLCDRVSAKVARAFVQRFAGKPKI